MIDSKLEAAESTILDYLHSVAPPGVRIDDDLDLIDHRVVDSLTFMNFIYLIEEVRGEAILLDQVDFNDFRTLRSVRERLLRKARN